MFEEVLATGNSFTAAMGREAATIAAEIAAPLSPQVTTTEFQSAAFAFDISGGIDSEIDGSANYAGVMPVGARYLDESGPSVEAVIREMMSEPVAV